MIIGGKQANLAANKLSVCMRSALRPKQGHLRLDLRQGVLTVHTYLIGVTGMVARGARKIAFWKNAMRTFTAYCVAAEKLSRSTNRIGQLGPSASERLCELWIDRSHNFRNFYESLN